MIAPRGVVLDLDDTLYLERDYVRSGFTAVGRYLAAHVGADADSVADHLWHRFLGGERGSHFDDLVSSDPALRGRVAAPQLIEVYRNHVPRISLLPGVRAMLLTLHEQGRPTALITDGALASQRAKVAALGLEDLIDGPLVLTDVWGREGWKPDPRAFRRVQEEWRLPHDDLIYIGDNPRKDFDAPRALGWGCVRLRLPGQLHHDVDDRIEPDLTVTSLEDLADALTLPGSLPPRLT